MVTCMGTFERFIHWTPGAKTEEKLANWRRTRDDQQERSLQLTCLMRRQSCKRCGKGQAPADGSKIKKEEDGGGVCR